jgi:hypothetical protein
MPIINPEAPHGALGELRAGKQTSSTPSYIQRAEVVLPKVERPTKPPRTTVTHMNPEPPHGALGELRAGIQTSSTPSSYRPRAEVVLPQVERPTKPPRKTVTQ